MPVFFAITHKEKTTRARTGLIHTDHGEIATPVFMPVGTQATLKSLDSADIEALGAQIILANAYHLHLRPGEDLIDSFGGLHQFMNWKKPLLTDSGGFQVFSLQAAGETSQAAIAETKSDSESSKSKRVNIDEDGVTFHSHIDGSPHRFTPESAIEIQHKLGADIIMAFDECTPDNSSETYAREAMERTHRWAKRCIEAQEKNTSYHGYRQFLFGIIQGANHRGLREESARVVSSLNFDGIAIGGESIGYNMAATKNILDWIYPFIPEAKPHYAMGLGSSPLDLFEVVERGVDMFDCVAPTRMARNGALFVRAANKNYRINITNAQFACNRGPIDRSCTCSTCTQYSCAYLHHLFAARELLAYRLATLHNVTFFLNLMADIRCAIQENRLLELKQQWSAC